MTTRICYRKRALLHSACLLLTLLMEGVDFTSNSKWKMIVVLDGKTDIFFLFGLVNLHVHCTCAKQVVVPALQRGCPPMWMPSNVAALQCGCPPTWLPFNWLPSRYHDKLCIYLLWTVELVQNHNPSGSTQRK
jgi:hypothetical protein